MVDIRVAGVAGLESMGDDVEREMTPALARAVLKGANFAGAAILKATDELFPGGTRALGRSFLPARFVKTKDGRVGAGALSNLVYARIQDEGGTIYPRSREYLAVPIAQEAKKLWPREWPKKKLFAFTSKDGRVFLAARQGKADLKLMYRLKLSVDIPPSNYLDQAMVDSEDDVVEIMAEAVDKALTEAFTDEF